MKDNKKIYILIAMLLIIIIGIIVIITKDFNYSSNWNNNTIITFQADVENENELKDTIKEIFENKIEEIQIKDKTVTVKLIEMQEVDKQTLINNLLEKNQISIDTEEITESNQLMVDFNVIIVKYVTSIFGICLLDIIYFIIKYRKKTLWKVLLVSCSIILMQLLYFSIIAILRIPVSNLILPIAIILFIATTYISDMYLEKIK